MSEIWKVTDFEPIRTAIFSPNGEYFAIGTNSRRLGIYNFKNLLDTNALELVHEKLDYH